MPRFSLMSMLSVAAFSLAAPAHASEPATVYQGDAAQGEPIASAVCGACHGPDGNSELPDNPRIAGQHAAYLFKQMKEFKAADDGVAVRANPIMNSMIAPYTEEQMKDFAAYFASKKQVAPAPQEGAPNALGQKLYRAGNAGKGLPACAACHGPKGAGMPVQYPRIAGQFAEYTEAQLKAFRLAERANDPNGMMRMIAEKMTDAEIRAVSEYVAGLH